MISEPSLRKVRVPYAWEVEQVEVGAAVLGIGDAGEVSGRVRSCPFHTSLLSKTAKDVEKTLR